MESQVAGRADEKGASGMDFLGIGDMRASSDPVCQQIRQLGERIFRGVWAGGNNNLCGSLETGLQRIRNIHFQVCAPNRLLACFTSAPKAFRAGHTRGETTSIS